MQEINIFTVSGNRLIIRDEQLYHPSDNEFAQRKDVALALNGKLGEIHTYHDGDVPSETNTYDNYRVHQTGDGELDEGAVFGLGCMQFDLKNTNILRDWAGLVGEDTKFWLSMLKKGVFALEAVKRAMRSAPKDRAESMRVALKLFTQQPKKEPKIPKAQTSATAA